MIRRAWRWVKASVVQAIHDQQLAEHGGLAGIRDLNLVRSALVSPQQSAAYENSGIAELAAAYAYGILRNHGFADGNKRAAFVTANVFLLDNGYNLIATDQEAVTTMLSAAEASMTEAELAAWFRGHIRKIRPGA